MLNENDELSEKPISDIDLETVKKPKYNSSGGLDVLVNHRVYGEIPMSIGSDYYPEINAKVLAGDFGVIEPYEKPQHEIESDNKMMSDNLLIVEYDAHWKSAIAKQRNNEPLTNEEAVAFSCDYVAEIRNGTLTDTLSHLGQ